MANCFMFSVEDYLGTVFTFVYLNTAAFLLQKISAKYWAWMMCIDPAFQQEKAVSMFSDLSKYIFTNVNTSN